MPNGDGHQESLGVELHPDHVVLIVGGKKRPIDPASSVQLALTLTHWLLDRMFHGVKASPLTIVRGGG